MTEDQYAKMQRLACCSMLPGSWDKRFIRNVSAMPIETELSASQAEQVERLWHKYRRQHKGKVANHS